MKAPQRPAPPAQSRALTGDLQARWKYLQRRVGPVLSPPALAVVVALTASLLFSAVIQFGTTIFSDAPGLSIGLAGFNGLLALAALILIVLRGRWLRAQIVLAIALVGILLLSIVSLGGKIQYQRGLAGNPYYALPHGPSRYPAEATTVSLQTSDGVRLAATQIGSGHTRAILIYPSWRTDRDAFSVSTLATWLANGFDVLVLDPRGQGESDGVKTPDGAAHQDILAGVSYLRAHGHLQVGVFAELDGAYPAVLAAGAGRGIDSLALAAPSPTWGGSLGQDGRFWDPTTLRGRLYWRVVAGLRLAPGPKGPPLTTALRGVSPTPVLFIGHRTEAGTQVDPLHHAAREPKSLLVLPGTERPSSWAQFAQYFQMIEQWFSLSLPAAPAASQP